MRSHHFWLPLSFAAVTLLALPGKSAPKGFEKEYSAGLKLEAAGQFAEAKAAFEAIPVPHRDWATKSHLANLEAKSGHLLTAQKKLEALRNETTDPDARATTESDLADLTARIPKIKITVSAGSDDIHVTVDGTTIQAPAVVLVDPGPHRVIGHRGSGEVFERKLDIAEGTTIDVAIDAPRPIKLSTVPASSPSTPEGDSPAKATTTRSVGWIVGGAGLLTVAAGTFFTFRALSLRDDRDELAMTGDAAGAADKHSSAQSSLTIARIALAAGGLALGTGLVLVLTAPAKKDAPRLAAGALVGPGVASLRVEALW